MKKELTKIQKDLFSMRDEKYRLFTSKLMPTVSFDTVIGVRTPQLREYSKSIDSTEATRFLAVLPHEFYEENNLHAFLIEKIKDYDTCINELNRFLPLVDNWATCDMLRPKVFAKHKDSLIRQIELWLKSKDTYAVRFGIEMLMVHYLDIDFREEYMELVAGIISDEYYIMMMQAWYFATALAKQYNCAVVYLEELKLPKWVHNKTISKACDSYRITKEQKEYLKSLRY